MDPQDKFLFHPNAAASGAPDLRLTRRQLFGLASAGIGTAALATLMGEDLRAAGAFQGLPHFAPKAKRVIYLFQSGGPVADGSVRLQAEAARSARHGAARLDPAWGSG